MRTVHQVDWVDELGKRHRRHFDSPLDATTFERVTRGRIYIARALQLGITQHEARTQVLAQRRRDTHEIRLDR